MKAVSYYIILVIIEVFSNVYSSLDKQYFDRYLFFYFFREIYSDVFELDPSNIKMIQTFDSNLALSLNDEPFKCQLAIVSGILNEGFDENFKLEKLSSKYGRIKVDCINQPSKSETPVDFTYQEMSINQYYNYSKYFKSSEPLKFASNIDMDQRFADLKKILKAGLPKCLHWVGDFDILRYSNGRVYGGINEPQLYFKVPDVWTGAHDETLCLRSVNCNHGPGASFWIGTQTEDDNTLLDNALIKEGLNFEDIKQRFFPSIEFCLHYKIKILCGVQYANQIVLVGPGNRHW